jgi:hypothetical protein
MENILKKVNLIAQLGTIVLSNAPDFFPETVTISDDEFKAEVAAAGANAVMSVTPNQVLMFV